MVTFETLQGFVRLDEQDVRLYLEFNWFLTGTKGCQYLTANIGGKKVKLHRAIAERADINVSGDIDHINGDTLDNRRANLRSATVSQNLANSKTYRNNTSGFKGVCKGKAGTWKARLSVGGKRYESSHHTALEAAIAYDRLALKHYGEFARTNKSIGLY